MANLGSKIKRGDQKGGCLLDLLLSLTMSFLLVIISAWSLHLIEAHYLERQAQARQVNEMICPKRMISDALPLAYEGGFLFKLGQILGIKTAQAADYGALKMIESEKSLTLGPGETKELTIGFKNTGTLSWKGSGKNYISIYTYGPKYRTSRFQHPDWLAKDQPTKLKDAEIKPGQIGYLLCASKDQPIWSVAGMMKFSV